MRITITARHCEVPELLRERARARLERLSRFAPRSQRALVVFGAENGKALVELRLHTPRGHLHVATAQGADHRTAFDQGIAKLRRQLER
jgi:ribosomal subunit interface protein